MTPKIVLGACVVAFAVAIALVFIATDPGDDLGFTNLILGKNGESDVLILTSKNAAILPEKVDNITDLWGITPVEFLKALKMERSTTDEFIFREPIKNWIARKDLPGLLAMTDSQEPCASVALMSSSTWNSQGSSMRQEALFMIAGYRKGEYPPALNSGGYDQGGATELIDWCRAELAKPGN